MTLLCWCLIIFLECAPFFSDLGCLRVGLSTAQHVSLGLHQSGES